MCATCNCHVSTTHLLGSSSLNNTTPHTPHTSLPARHKHQSTKTLTPNSIKQIPQKNISKNTTSIMLEEAIPSLWSAVHGWFTPAVLFVLLNLVIGTIAVTSKSTSTSGESSGDGPRRHLSRAPSIVLDRLRSFNLSHALASSPPPPAIAGTLDAAPEPELADTKQEHHPERSKSEAAMEVQATRLPARMRKSASEKSAFAHFEEMEVEAEENKLPPRPKTSRAAVFRRDEAEEEMEMEMEVAAAAAGEAEEVDARCDDFINRFRQQLKLQRLDSIVRYKEMLRRGAAAN